MALKKCKECGTEISKKAKTCPNCGAPNGPKQFSIGKLIILIAGAGLIYSMWSAGTNSSGSSQYQATAAQKQISDYFLSDKEPKVKDAHWTSKNNLKLGMINDGSTQNGFAQYACELLRGTQVTIDIIDVVKLSQHGEWTTLGSARWSYYKERMVHQ